VSETPGYKRPSTSEQLLAAKQVAGPQEPWPACTRCGGCCRGLLLEVDHADVVREPRIIEHAVLLDGHGDQCRHARRQDAAAPEVIERHGGKA